MKDIMQRVNEIKVKDSLGMQVAYDYDFAWMGPIDRSAQSAINALQRLENPIAKLKEEMTWFWFGTDTDHQAIDCLVKGNRQGAHELWKEVVSSKGHGNGSISALINQLILAHSSVIGKEILLRYGDTAGKVVEMARCPKCNVKFKEGYTFCIKCGFKLTKEKLMVEERKKNLELTDDHWKNWRFVLSRFLALNSSDAFWKEISEKIKTSGDPRLLSLKIDQVKESFSRDIVNVNLTFIVNALFGKDYERAKQHSQLLNGASVSPEILREGFNRILASRIELLGRLCKTTSQKASEISEKDSLDDLLKIYESFKKECGEVANECNIVDINCMSDFALSRDNIAEVLRNISIKINNSFNAYDKAYSILEESIAYTASTYLKNAYQKDRDVLKNNLEEEQSLQYQEKIGNEMLKISRNSISLGGTVLQCSNIDAIKYGIFVSYTNGIPTERSYAIWLASQKRVIEIECARGLFLSSKMQKRFSEILEKIYKIVQIPLALKDITDFEANRPVEIGGVIIDHKGWHNDFSYNPISKGVVSLAAKIFGTEDAESKEAKKKFMPWSDYNGYLHHEGKIIIFRKNEKKGGNGDEWVSFTLRDVWNAVNLSILLDYLHKDGKLWMIIHKTGIQE